MVKAGGRLSDRELLALMRVEVPEGRILGMFTERFQVEPGNWRNTYLSIHGRGTAPGWYTVLAEEAPELRDKRRVWMSDTDAERRDHLPALHAIQRLRARRVLVNGLGLGMVIKAALALSTVEHVDVVERDGRVISLTGPVYTSDPRVHITRGDALEQCFRWPQGARWDVAWHDIWPTGDPQYREELETLTEAYAGRVRWQGAWAADAIMDD